MRLLHRHSGSLQQACKRLQRFLGQHCYDLPGCSSCIDDVCTTISMYRTFANSQNSVAYVKGRDAFRRNGQNATIGKYAFAFEWAAFACLFLATVLFCIGRRGNKDTTKPSRNSGFFGGNKRSKSTRSRGSFVDGNEPRSSFTRASFVNGDERRSSFTRGAFNNNNVVNKEYV